MDLVRLMGTNLTVGLHCFSVAESKFAHTLPKFLQSWQRNFLACLRRWIECPKSSFLGAPVSSKVVGFPAALLDDPFPVEQNMPHWNGDFEKG
jgi:hypothetical protein